MMFFHVRFYNRRIHFIVDIGTVERFRFPFVIIGINRFDTAGNPQHRRKSPCRRNGQELGIAQPVLADQGRRFFRRIGLEIGRAHDFFHMAHVVSPPFAGKPRRSGNSCIGHGKAYFMTEGHGFRTAIGQTQLDQHITETHDAQTDLAPLLHAVTLFLQGMQGQAFFQHVIESPDGNGNTPLEFRKIKGRIGRKRMLYKLSQIHTAQETGPACRQRFFCTGIDTGKRKFLCICQKIPVLDAVPEQGTRFGIIPVRFCQQMEDIGGLDHRFDSLPRFLPRKMETECLVLFYGLHEFIAQADGYIGFGHLIQIGLQFDEIDDIGMAAVNGNHEGAAAAILANQFRNQRIEGHKRYGSARFLRRIIDARSLRAEAGNIDAAATAVAIGTGQFSCPVKNTFDIIFRRHHDVTVGQGDFFPFIFQPSVGQDTAAEQKFLLLQQFCHFCIMAADAVQPVIKCFSIIAVLILPDIEAELVIRTEPFFFIHSDSSIKHRMFSIYCRLLPNYILYMVCKSLTL